MVTAPRVKIPERVVAGDIITVKTLASHRMESGERRDENGKPIPRHIIHRFEARFEKKLVFAMDLEPAVSANPYIEFSLRVDNAGTLVMTWTDDAGEVIEFSQAIVTT